MADKKQASGGVGILGVVFIVLLTLKLADVSPVGEWSWWWVTSPLWGGVVLFLAVLAAIFGGALILGLLAAPFRWNARRKHMRDIAGDDA